MYRILALVLVIFALVACSDDSTSKDAAIADATTDAAVEMSVQLEASAEASTDLVVTDSSSDTVSVDAGGE